MQLKIWARSPSSDVLDALSSVVKHHQDVHVELFQEAQAPVTGDVWLCLGKEPISVLEELKVIHKGRTTTSLRKKVHTWGPAKVMFSYAPGVSKMNYAYYVDLLCDTATAFQLVRTGGISPTYGAYRYVSSFDALVDRVEALYAQTGQAVEVALDLETIGFDEFRLPEADHPGAYIVSIQLSCEPGTADVLYFPSREEEERHLADMTFAAQVAWLLSTPKISLRGANLKFDLRWLWQRGGFECTNFKFDTTLVGSLLDENRTNGLDVHTKIYYAKLGGYSDAFDLTVDKSRMDLVPKDVLLPYAGGDADATLGVSIAQKAELLQDAKLTSFYINILHPAARAFELIERNGVCIDREAYAVLEADLKMEVVAAVQTARSIVGGRLVAKHADSRKPGGMNLTKASFLVDFMFSPMGLNLKPKVFTPKTGEPSTGVDHLEMFADHPAAAPFIEQVSRYQAATKTLSTFVYGFLKHLRSDGRFHPNYFFFVGDRDDDDDGGAVTGRLSCKAPPFQVTPKHTKWGKRIRSCFVAPPGYLVMERDYSQGELKVIACIANEQAMLEAYRQGMDLHVKTAAPFAGYTYEQMMALKEDDSGVYDLVRQLGKAGNFGLIYGMMPEGFYTYAVKNYGVKDFSVQKAATFRDSFFQTYPGLPEYHKEYKAFARKYGFVRSPLGRIRHLPLINSPMQDIRARAERQAINSAVQGTLSDMLIWSAAEEKKAGLAYECPAFGAIHDAMYNYVKEDKVDDLAKKHIEIMENLPFHRVGWTPQLNFTADAKIGPNMGNLKKWAA